MIRDQKVKIINTDQQLVTQEMLGIGLIIKSTCVFDLVEKARKDLDRINSSKNI